jgi:two-component system, chemotaxis family, protein-glutamate methylesterase/glutaminase
MAVDVEDGRRHQLGRQRADQAVLLSNVRSAGRLPLVSATRHSEDSPFDVVVIVGSLGARVAFEEIARHLPEHFPAAVILDLHRNDAHGRTAQLLARRITQPVRLAGDGMVTEVGTVYLGPWDHALRFDGERRLALAEHADGGRGHLFADVLLRSAAAAFGPRVIAVVLSGRLNGGAAGIVEIKRGGGRVLVQDPATAEAPSMPNAALATGCVDFALEPAMIGHALAALCAAPGADELFRVRMNAGVRG